MVNYDYSNSTKKEWNYQYPRVIIAAVAGVILVAACAFLFYGGGGNPPGTPGDTGIPSPAAGTVSDHAGSLAYNAPLASGHELDAVAVPARGGLHQGDIPWEL